MKKWYLALWALLFMSRISVAEYDGFRTFTDPENRTIQARILEYDAAKGRIQIVREGGKKAWVSPDIFSDVDQTYIEQWVAADCVLAEKNLRVSINKSGKQSFGEATDQERGDIVYYEVKLENRSRQDVGALKIDYRVYIDVRRSDLEKESTRVDGDVIAVDHIAEGETQIVCPKGIRLIEQYFEQSEFNSVSDSKVAKTQEEDIRGIWIKIYGPEVEGIPSIRDVYYPERFKKNNLDWVDDRYLNLEFVRKRGHPRNTLEQQKWTIEALSRLKAEKDINDADLYDKELRIFYERELDPSGINAMLIALSFYEKEMSYLALRWFAEAASADSVGQLCIFTCLFEQEIISKAYNSEEFVNIMFVLPRDLERYRENCSPEENAVICSIGALEQALNGEYQLAVQKQSEAIQFLQGGPSWVKKMYEERLELYESGQRVVFKDEDPREWVFSIKVDGEPFFSTPEPLPGKSPLLKMELDVNLVEQDDTDSEDEVTIGELLREGLSR